MRPRGGPKIAQLFISFAKAAVVNLASHDGNADSGGVVNASTPGYIQKDLSVDEFQKHLAAKAAEMDSAGPGSVNFNDISLDSAKPDSLLFHDGSNRSMEQLMSDQAKNALMHNLAVELLRRQYMTLDMAIKERPE